MFGGGRSQSTSSMEGSNTSISTPSRLRNWLPSILPVQALPEDTFNTSVDDSLTRLLLQPDEAMEVREEASTSEHLDAAAEDRALPMAFNCSRHTEGAADVRPSDDDGANGAAQSWRMRERMKTVSVALVVCLNVGVDPPDVTKTQPCARTECWIDPTTLNPQRAIEAIGKSLQQQYDRWQPKARYRQSLDPPLEEVRRLATGLRRNAREERVLFHYNGHGVPKPTANGEVWVFNRNYTQYIPLSLYDLQAWMGSPSIFVYDCSNAGIIVQAFETFAEQHEKEYYEQVNSQGVDASELPPNPPVSLRNCIQLAACAANQILPMNPELPADLFTSCLTTPIKMALRWFVMQRHGKLAPEVTIELLEKIPGQFGDRRTMLGELNWIFTAITDTIAWNTLPREVFQKLFRQDLLVASLFRNFLLAERIMRSYDCTPISQPALPPTHQHPMWKAWDMAVDISLAQLPGIAWRAEPYFSSSFFEEQLTAFEVWLRYGREDRPSPEQLPIVLQVLLSQAHRLRALDLLGRFLDIGPWAVNLALSVGIFPYVLKLLQSTARELRPLLVSIWAKILAVDTSCKNDLIREASHKYFIAALQDDVMMPQHRTWTAFILATIVNQHPVGQKEAEQANLIAICLEYLDDKEPVTRQWLAIALGRVWDKYEPARWRGARDNAHEKLYELLKDPVPEVRAAAVFALGTFVNSCEERTEHANKLDHGIALHVFNTVVDDASPLVRKELVLLMAYVVSAFEANFVTLARVTHDEEQILAASTANLTVGGGGGSNTLRRNASKEGLKRMTGSASATNLDSIVGAAAAHGSSGNLRSLATGTVLNNSLTSLSTTGIYTKIWHGFHSLAFDPHQDVASMSEAVLHYLRLKARDSQRFTSRISSILETASVPSSPAKPSFMIGGKEGLQSQRTGPPSVSSNNSSGEGERAKRANSQENGPPPTGTLPPGVARGTQSHNPSPNSTMTNTRDLRMPDLTTGFLTWSSRYFNKQLSKHVYSDRTDCDWDYESERHWTNDWLYKRNIQVRTEAEVQRDILKGYPSRLDEPLAVPAPPAGTPSRNSGSETFRTTFQPSLIQFHPYNAQVTVAGQRHIHIHDLEINSVLGDIDLRDKRYQRTRFTALSYVNAQQRALLLAGSNDGGVRLYTDDERTGRMKLITAWSALKEMSFAGDASSAVVPQRSRVGLSLAWEQRQGVVVVGGDSGIVRIWDAARELSVVDLQTGTSALVTCLSFAPGNSYQLAGLLMAGFSDGSTRLYDHRSDRPLVACYREDDSRVLDVQLHDVGGFTDMFLAGSKSGKLNIFDPRQSQNSALLREINLGGPLSNLSIHKRAPLVAGWGQQSSAVSVHTLLPHAGAQLNVIKQGTFGAGVRSRATPGCLAFHPHLLQLATGPVDGAINIYKLRKYS